MTHPSIRPIQSELQHKAPQANYVLYFQLLMTKAVKIEWCVHSVSESSEGF